MERFEMMIDSGLIEFKGFLGKTKDTIGSLIEDIKNHISVYERRIQDTEEEISDAENSSRTCEQEIARLQEQINNLKKSIDNVEKTYKKMVEAYSSTSEGSTKDIYGDIIENARENCERDVEKNNAEIDNLTDSIYGIKNNIKEFNSSIDGLNRDLEDYKFELAKYTRALQYMQKVYDGVIDDLSDIETGKNSRIKPVTKKTNESVIESKKETNHTQDVQEDITDKQDEDEKKEIPNNNDDPAEELQRIYDLTGYTPSEKKEETKEETKEENTVYSGNLENLFLNSGVEDIKSSPSNDDALQQKNVYNDNELSEWEEMLNEKTITFDEPLAPKEEDTVNQLLKPYGTTYEELISFADDRIEYKDGTILPLEISREDVINAINQIDSIDLKAMKIVGPITTLLKKIKKLKEEAK